MPGARRFYPMSWGDLAYLLAVLAFALVAFLPWSRDAKLGGMAMLGWMMVALMVFAPAVALLRIVTEKRRAPTSKNQGAEEGSDD